VKERLENSLLQNSYRKISSNLAEITLYACFMMDSVQAVQLMDYRNAPMLSKEQYELVKQRAGRFFQSEGYETVHLLTIILTPDVQEAKKFVLDDSFCWIVDSSVNRLIIFENQREDFYGLRKFVEQACTLTESGGTEQQERVAEEKPKQRKKTPWYIKPAYQRTGIFAKNYAPVNFALVAVNIAVFIYLSIIGSTKDLEFMLKYGVMYVPYVTEYHEYYRFFTCMFLHFGIQHLAGNMVVLFFLGDNVERAAGKIKYLIIYIGSGLAGSFGSFLFSYLFNQNIVSAGASGAIFGVIGALLWIVIRNRGRLEDITTFRVALLIFYALYMGIRGENIDNAAHVAGLLGGFLLAVILYEKKSNSQERA